MANVWINEFHYDNSAANDPNEFIEIAGFVGTNLNGWKIQLYNGSNGQVYHTFDLTGTIKGPSESAFWFHRYRPTQHEFHSERRTRRNRIDRRGRKRRRVFEL